MLRVIVGFAGGVQTVNADAELVLPLPVTVTAISPVVAVDGTVTVRLVSVAPDTTAATPLKVTVLFAGVMLKFVPVIVTVVPVGPDVGVKEVIVGG